MRDVCRPRPPPSYIAASVREMRAPNLLAENGFPGAREARELLHEHLTFGQKKVSWASAKRLYLCAHARFCAHNRSRVYKLARFAGAQKVHLRGRNRASARTWTLFAGPQKPIFGQKVGRAQVNAVCGRSKVARRQNPALAGFRRWATFERPRNACTCSRTLNFLAGKRVFGRSQSALDFAPSDVYCPSDGAGLGSANLGRSAKGRAQN